MQHDMKSSLTTVITCHRVEIYSETVDTYKLKHLDKVGSSQNIFYNLCHNDLLDILLKLEYQKYKSHCQLHLYNCFNHIGGGGGCCYYFNLGTFKSLYSSSMCYIYQNEDLVCSTF